MTRLKNGSVIFATGNQKNVAGWPNFPSSMS